LPRAARIDLLPGQHEVERLPQPDEAWKALGSAGTREQAQLDLGQAELGLRGVACDPIRAGEGELNAPAQRDTVDGGDDRYPQHLYPLQHAVTQPAHVRSRGGRIHLAELLDVRPGD